MSLNLLTQFITFIHRLLHRVRGGILDFTKPAASGQVMGSLADFARSKSELLAENALLRQQLIVLRRSVKRPKLTRTDRVLIVTTPEVSAVRDADRVIGLVEADLKGPPKLIINRLNPAMVKRGNMMTPTDVLEILNIDLIGVVPEDPGVLVSTNKGIQAAMDATSNGAGASYRDIPLRLMGQNIPIQPIRD